MRPTVGDVISIMDTIAPEAWAEDWDNVGLQAGEMSAPIDRVLVALEISEPVIEEAIDEKAGLILTHHPMYLTPPARITDGSGMGRLMLKMIRAGIAHYAAHTNLDKSTCSPDAALCDILGLTDVVPLAPEIGEGHYQLVAFCPEEDVRKVRDALFAAGCGQIGAYSACSFSGKGTGTFRPGEGTSPRIGKQGELSEVAEVRLEAVTPRRNVGKAVAALRAAHPYEEPVIDLYPIGIPVPGVGTGRVGSLPATLRLTELAAAVKEGLHAPAVTVSGGGDVPVKRLALCAGAGADLIGQAMASGADAFLTGEIKHHELLDISHEGFPVIAAGHYHTEAPVMEMLAVRLRQDMEASGYAAIVGVSERIRAAYRMV